MLKRFLLLSALLVGTSFAQITQSPAAGAGGGDASEATLATRLAEATYTGRTGEVQASPTAYTLLGRLKAIEDALASLLTELGGKTEPANTQTVSGTVTGNMDVLTLPALPAGTNNIGDVDVLTLPALPAGTNNIGDVDVLTLPALPAGSNSIGTVHAVGNAGVAFDGATAATIPAGAIFEGGVGKSAQPTAVSDGQMVGALRSLDGAAYVKFGGPITWSCGLNAVGTTLTQCQAAPGAGLSLYITDILTQSTTTTSGLWTLRYGTGANCGTGTGNIFANVATASLANAANTLVAPVRSFLTPIKIPANNALCALGVATNTTNITIMGFTAP